jgi:purine-cytosine permease-like protein
VLLVAAAAAAGGATGAAAAAPAATALAAAAMVEGLGRSRIIGILQLSFAHSHTTSSNAAPACLSLLTIAHKRLLRYLQKTWL